MRVLGVITARGGSKGIPGKNIKQLLGKPLIAWTIEAAQQSTVLTECIVSTDDEEIAQVARQYNANVPFLRPKELAEDTTPHLVVMRHAIEEMEALRGEMYDVVVILQPTSPFRTAEMIDATVRTLIQENTDSAVTVYPIDGKEHPMKIKKIEGGRLVSYCMEEPEGVRRQDLPPAYKRSGDVYAITRDCIMQKNRLYGDSVAPYVIGKERVVDIDLPVDWIVAEYMAKNIHVEA